MSFLFKSDKKASSSQPEEKKAYLEPENVVLLPVVVGRLHDASRLPPRNEVNEWLATNCIQFFNQINTQYGIIAEMCKQDTCPVMSAGSQVYEWQETKSGRKQKLSARQYVDTAMSFVQKTMQDENIFPTKFGRDFPDDCEQIVKRIFKVYFSILAHIYLHHYHEMLQLHSHDILNSLFLHFVYFNQEFRILEHKDLAILEDLMMKLVQKDAELAQKLREAGQLPT